MKNAGLVVMYSQDALSLGTPEDIKPRVLFIEEPETHLFAYHDVSPNESSE